MWFFIAGIGVSIRCDGNSSLMTLNKFKNAKYNVEVCSWSFHLVKSGLKLKPNIICLIIETLLKF